MSGSSFGSSFFFLAQPDPARIPRVGIMISTRPEALLELRLARRERRFIDGLERELQALARQLELEERALLEGKELKHLPLTSPLCFGEYPSGDESTNVDTESLMLGEATSDSDSEMPMAGHAPSGHVGPTLPIRRESC